MRHTQDAAIPLKLHSTSFGDSLVRWSFRHGPIPFGRIELSNGLPSTEISRFDPTKGLILLNASLIADGTRMFDDPHSGDASMDLERKIHSSLRAQSFLLDLHCNERMFSRDGPLGKGHEFAISPLAYEAARNNPALAKRIACEMESWDPRNENDFRVSLSLGAQLSGIFHLTRNRLSGRKEYEYTPHTQHTLDRESSDYFVGRLLSDLSGFTGPMNQDVLISALGPQLTEFVEAACSTYIRNHALPPYRGGALDYVRHMQSYNRERFLAILNHETPDGRSLRRLMLESRSCFGRYSQLYHSLIEPFKHQEAWEAATEKPVRVAICGVGLNEEPITLAIMLFECARKLGIEYPKLEVHVLSESGEVLTRLKESETYPYPYSCGSVWSGLSKVFGADTSRIIATYFEHENGYLVPGPQLRNAIQYHEFKVGHDQQIPAELNGECRFLTVHNVLQYVGKDTASQHLDGAVVEGSFRALRSTVEEGGRVSVLIESTADAKVNHKLPILTA